MWLHLLWSSLGCHSLSVTTRHNDEQSGWVCNHTLDSTSKYESLPTMVKPIVGVTHEAEPQGPRKNVFILPKYYLFLLVLSFTENMCISNKVTLNDSHNSMKEVVMCISNKSSIG